jgi:outer membrane protein
MKLKKHTLIFIGAVLFTIAALLINNAITRKKTGYVEIKELYNNFSLKKELENKFLEVKNARQKILDSLMLDLKFIENKIKTEKNNKNLTLEFENKKDVYLQKKQVFEEDNLKLTQQYDSEILSQLNQYIKNYGKENHYQYIYGADGTGFLLYADEAKNITKEVTGFINNNYQGKPNK